MSAVGDPVRLTGLTPKIPFGSADWPTGASVYPPLAALAGFSSHRPDVLAV